MSVILIDQQVVHYETFGRGRPVLFLHGWLGSWRYWLPTMEVAAQRFRAYSFDFWGFGDSQKNSRQSSIEHFSDQVIRFLDAMGLEQVPLVGHSMGGMVALQTAIRHPKRISRVVAVGAPIVGSSLSILLQATNNPAVAWFMTRQPGLTKLVFRWFLGHTDDPAYGEILDDSVKPTEESVRRSIGSMRRTDLRPQLDQLQVPALIMHGARDDIVNPNQPDIFLERDVPQVQVCVLPTSRHFPFLDEPHLFNKILLSFLEHRPAPPRQPDAQLVEPMPQQALL